VETSCEHVIVSNRLVPQLVIEEQPDALLDECSVTARPFRPLRVRPGQLLSNDANDLHDLRSGQFFLVLV